MAAVASVDGVVINMSTQDVVQARIRPTDSVNIVPDEAFKDSNNLQFIDILEGMVGIGDYAFAGTSSLEVVHIASSVKRIGSMAFGRSRILSIDLPDSIESIGVGAFCGCRLPSRFRIPSLITTLSEGVLYGCRFMISLEIPEGATEFEGEAFAACRSLRNVALPFNTNIDVEDKVFEECTSLEGILGSEEYIINALKTRFEGLPIHKMLYYQSYNNLTLEQLNNATNMRSGSSRSLRSKLDPSGNQQDTLGMTPLHILACSTVQNIDMYRIIVDKYPDNLITKDKWGALPILYVIWGEAPLPILHFLINSHKSLHPNFVFDSDKMFETLARADAPWEVLTNFSESQLVFNWGWNWRYWQSLLEKLVDSTPFSEPGITPTAFQFMSARALAPRLQNIGCLFKVFIDENLSFEKAVASVSRKAYLNEVMSELEQFESKYHGIKDATTQLELALWHKKIEETVQMKKRPRKAKKSDASSSIRSQCRINCGANIIIPLVLPYLVPAWNPSSGGGETVFAPEEDFSEDDDSMVSIPP